MRKIYQEVVLFSMKQLNKNSEGQFYILGHFTVSRSFLSGYSSERYGPDEEEEAVVKSQITIG